MKRIENEKNWFDLYFDSSSTQLLTNFKTSVNGSLDITLQTLSEIFEHCGTTAQHNIIVQRSPNINRTILNDIIHNFIDWCSKIRI